MTFIIVLLCLFAERYILELDHYRQPSWFNRYLNWSQQLPWGEWMSQSISGILITLAPLLIAAGLFQAMFEDILGGIPELLFASIVLLFCLGPKDLQRQVQGFIDALDTGNEASVQHLGSGFITTNPDKGSTYSQSIAVGILKQAYIRTFSVIFWFVILGPLGAILYRSCHTLKHALPELNDLGLDFRSGVNNLLYILDWIPVRITAFTYALSGNFHNATYAWWNSQSEEDDNTANDIIAKAGIGALGLDGATDRDEDPSLDAEMALALALRTLTIWVGLLALITVTSWIS